MAKSSPPILVSLNGLLIPFPPNNLMLLVWLSVVILSSIPSSSPFKSFDFFTISKTPFIKGFGKTIA